MVIRKGFMEYFRLGTFGGKEWDAQLHCSHHRRSHNSLCLKDRALESSKCP